MAATQLGVRLMYDKKLTGSIGASLLLLLSQPACVYPPLSSPSLCSHLLFLLSYLPLLAASFFFLFPPPPSEESQGFALT